jgi:hypothetical protein
MLEQKGLYYTRSDEGYEFRRLTIFKCQYLEGGRVLNVPTEFLSFEDGTGGVLFHIKRLAWLPPHEALLEGQELYRVQNNIKNVVDSWRVTNAQFDVEG